MKKMSSWKDSEVKSLFNCIENSKKNNRSLLEGFKNFAKKSKRKTNSVRNYYYLEIDNLKKDMERAKRLGIDLSAHNVQRSDKFSNKETEELVTEILRLKCLGFSVRKACLQLANNSAEEMLRYQNKFRSTMKNNKQLYNRCLIKLKEKGLSPKFVSKADMSEKNENLVYMKKPEAGLSDEEVNSLFLGLVKLVKKNTIEKMEQDLISETEFANSTLRETLIKVSNLEKEIEKKSNELRKEVEKNEKTTEENFKLKTKIAEIITGKIEKGSKNKSLAKYLRDIKDKGREIKTKI